ncbi:hypothetical protein B0H14DRAFT_2634738 [Mycena olivaceomarginata]|nr:hypothetical protein B0H14DRAFT_2634738 [Mycena olivaceomarginata]
MTGEQLTCTKLAQVQLEMVQHQNTTKFAPPEYHEDAKAEYAKLFKEQAALTKSLSTSAGQSIALLGGTLSLLLPPPNSPPDVQYKPPPLLFLVVIFLSCANLALTVSHHANPGFWMYALNMNSIGGPRNISHVNSVLSQRAPHTFVISETKKNEKLSSKLPSSEYNIFEEEAVPMSHGKGHKWGVAVGIRKDLQVSQCVLITKASLKGIDVVLPTNLGHGFMHHIMGVYAPWDPGINNVDPDAREFWSDVTTFCNETRTSWLMAGDCNATVAALERAADNGDVHVQFNHFLLEAHGHDLWSDVADRN